MPDKTASELLDLYLAGEATPEQSVRVRELLEAYPEQNKAVEQLVGGLAGIDGGVANVPSSHAALERFKDRQVRSLERKGVYSRKSWRWWVGYAGISAVAILLVVAFTPVLYKQFVFSKTQTAPALREYVTASGERATITLKDGTSVTLNVASRLRVPADYGESSRTVFLDGEARFSVTNKVAAPFLVNAAGTTTRVLGTVFGVRAYPGTSGVQVVVVQGKVSLRAPVVTVSPEVTLVAGDRVVMGPDGQVRQTHDEPVQRYMAWTTGELYIDEMPVSDALTQLGIWYNLEFRISDSALMTRHITLAVLGNTLTDAQLHEIATALDATATRNGRIITLTAKESL